jgi:hypothetical protein
VAIDIATHLHEAKEDTFEGKDDLCGIPFQTSAIVVPEPFPRQSRSILLGATPANNKNDFSQITADS